MIKTELKEKLRAESEFPTMRSENETKYRINYRSCHQVATKDMEIGTSYLVMGRILKIIQENQNHYSFIISDGTAHLNAHFLVFGHELP